MYKIKIENENGEVMIDGEYRGYLLCGVNDIDELNAEYDLSLQDINMMEIMEIDEMIEEGIAETIFPPHNCDCNGTCESCHCK